MTEKNNRTALVTGATGYIGSQVAEELRSQGWRVRAFCRSRDKGLRMAWGKYAVPQGQHAHGGQVEIFEGDASSAEDVRTALTGVDVAWYLLHSMSASQDFAAQDAQLAKDFAQAAQETEVQRIIYLGGLHPESGELSEHLRSRVQVGKIFLESPVPAAALQAGVVLGVGSSSFVMLRHLAERLPGAVAPKWIKNRITPISARDAVYYLTRAADLPADTNRAFDIGGPDTLSYADMMKRYARTLNLTPRVAFSAPVTTPNLGSHWIALVTPVSRRLAKPLVQSLLNETVVKERDIEAILGTPDGGAQIFEDAVQAGVLNAKVSRWRTTAYSTAAAVTAAEVLDRLLAGQRGIAMRASRLAWGADLSLASALVLADAGEASDRRSQARYWVSLAAYLGADVVHSALEGKLARTGTGSSAGLTARVLASATGALLTGLGWRSSPERGAALLPAALMPWLGGVRR